MQLPPWLLHPVTQPPGSPSISSQSGAPPCSFREPVRSPSSSSKPHQRPLREKCGPVPKNCALRGYQGIWVCCENVYQNFKVISNLAFCYMARSLATAGGSRKCLQSRVVALLSTSLLLDVGMKNALLSGILGSHGRSQPRACRTCEFGREFI